MTDSSTWVCTTCGMIGREVLAGLSRPCIGVMKSRGSDNWSRIQKGLALGESRWAKAFNAGRVVRRAKLEGQKQSKEGVPRNQEGSKKGPGNTSATQPLNPGSNHGRNPGVEAVGLRLTDARLQALHDRIRANKQRSKAVRARLTIF